jgi:uncharacterized lipoprotein YmbA
MNLSAPIKWTLPVMLAGALGGCLNTSPVTDSRRFFVLEPGPASYRSILAEAADTIVGLKPIMVPAYLRDTRIVVRQSETEIDYSEVIRWGEPLGLGLERVIRGNLDAALEDSIVIQAPWRREGVGYQVNVRFHRCEVDTSGQVITDAEWLCSKIDDPSKTVFGQGTITKTGPRPADDPDGAVTTLSTTIHELSLQIAESARACIDGIEESN